MNYCVCFYKNDIFTEEFTRVYVKASSHSGALRNARRKGYLSRDGWKWASITPNPTY